MVGVSSGAALYLPEALSIPLAVLPCRKELLEFISAASSKEQALPSSLLTTSGQTTQKFGPIPLDISGLRVTMLKCVKSAFRFLDRQ